MNNTVLLERNDQVATLTLNRPASLNALNDDMAYALRDCLRQVGVDDRVRCLVIKGAGEHFMAGGDIEYFERSTRLDSDVRRHQVDELIGVVHDSIISLRAMHKPVVAMLRGSVAGFGMSLMMASDLAVASDNTSFVQAYTQIATTPDGGNTYHLPRIVGIKQAMAMTLLNQPLSAQQALAMGLVNQVVSDDELESTVAAITVRLVRAPRQATAQSKQLINQSLHHDLKQQLALERQSFTECALSDDFGEGVSAFLQKRTPNFQGE